MQHSGIRGRWCFYHPVAVNNKYTSKAKYSNADTPPKNRRGNFRALALFLFSKLNLEVERFSSFKEEYADAAQRNQGEVVFVTTPSAYRQTKYQPPKRKSTVGRYQITNLLSAW
jgi:hypothetical protein